MPPTGDQLLAILSALSNPQRLRIMAALAANGRNYVSRLAREVGISRPLLHLHLQRLEAAGLITSTLEVSDDGRALNYVAVVDFAIALDPGALIRAVRTLTAPSQKPEP